MVDHEQVDYESICEEIQSYPNKHKVCYVVFSKDRTKNDELSYDYVTRTYTLNIHSSDCFDSVVKAFELKENKEKVWKEIERATPTVLVNLKNKSVHFNNPASRILIIPEHS